jgi:hypothetical protein
MSEKIKFVPVGNIDLDAGNNVDSGHRPIGDIVRDLNAALKNNLPEIAGFENWGFWWHCEENKSMGLNDPWPPYHWIACYPVTGGSEAHYLHLDLIRSGDVPHRHMLLVKVWGGWDEACAIANETARLLGA